MTTSSPRQYHPLIVTYQKMLTEAEERALFEEWRTTPAGFRKEQVFKKILLAYSPIVWKYSRKFAGYGIAQEDLISEGMLAMADVTKRFDPSKGFRFATYARAWVEGLMLAYIAKNFFTVSVCNNQKLKKLFFRLRREMHHELKKDQYADYGTEFFESIAKRMNADVDDVVTMFSLFNNPNESLQDTVASHGGEGDETTTKGDLMVSNLPGPDALFEEKSLNELHSNIVNKAIQAVLTDREKDIFVAQMLVDDQTTLQSLGDQFGLSKERVRQIREVAMKKVTNYIMTNVTTEQRDTMFHRD